VIWGGRESLKRTTPHELCLNLKKCSTAASCMTTGHQGVLYRRDGLHRTANPWILSLRLAGSNIRKVGLCSGVHPAPSWRQPCFFRLSFMECMLTCSLHRIMGRDRIRPFVSLTFLCHRRDHHHWPHSSARLEPTSAAEARERRWSVLNRHWA